MMKTLVSCSPGEISSDLNEKASCCALISYIKQNYSVGTFQQ